MTRHFDGAFSSEKFYFVCAFLMFFCSIMDFFFFKYYPLEADLFIDWTGRSKQELEKFMHMKNWLKAHPESKLTIMEMVNLEHKLELGNKGVTLAQAVGKKGTQMLFWASTLNFSIIYSYTSLNQKNVLRLNHIGYDSIKTSDVLLYVRIGQSISPFLSSLIYRMVFKRRFAISLICC